SAAAVATAGFALRRTANRLDGVFDVDLAGLLELQRALDPLALLERLADADEHQVIAAGLELDGLARLDLDAVRERTHLHHAVVHRHLMDLEFSGDLARAADQAVGRGAGVDELQVAAGNG